MPPVPFTHPVILFYKYTPIADPAAFVEEQRALCQSLHLKGRILIAGEGINGTLAGAPAGIGAYIASILADPRFTGMEFKWSEGSPDTFPKLMIKARREIVSLSLADDVDVATSTSTHLTPAQWREKLHSQDPGTVVIDVRNCYESAAGRFEGAITPDIENFRDLPAILSQLDHLKDKTILMYCTGGIRCEKAAALFQREGFRDVFQLHGGILAYHDQVGRDHWVGDCFVFDQRMVIPGQGDPAGKCAYTRTATNRFVNCLHDPCHRLYLLSPEAEQEDPERILCPQCKADGLTIATASFNATTSS